MLTIYPACFYKETDGLYSVIFPDLNHLATCGDTLEEAVRMAIDCLAGYVYDARLAGETLPPPSDLKSIHPDDAYTDYAEAFVNLVSVDVEAYAQAHFLKSVRKNLTIPQWLNDKAEMAGINFSAALQKALKQELHLHGS